MHNVLTPAEPASFRRLSVRIHRAPCRYRGDWLGGLLIVCHREWCRQLGREGDKGGVCDERTYIIWSNVEQGYGVLPQFRGQGLATWMLQRGLERVRALGDAKALVTCAEDNHASRRIIEQAGGAYGSSVYMPNEAAPTRRYWFELAR